MRLALLLLTALPAASPEASVAAQDATPARDVPNVLVLLADDLGLEFLSLYDGENALPPGIAERSPGVYPRIPTLERLAREGVRFTQARAMPSCAAARASILGGRYPFRHGIGALVRSSDASDQWAESETVEFGVGPGNEEVTLAHLARAAGLRSLQAGKWHLALQEHNVALGGQPGYGWDHIERVGGFDDHWAVWGNLSERNGAGAYTNFEVSDDGELREVHGTWATTAQVDRMLAWTGERGEAPWLIYAAFNAVHAPFEMPPGELVTSERYEQAMRVGGARLRSRERSDWPAWCAMIEALDRELGRLLDGLEEQGQLERTMVFFLADNGSPERVMIDAWERERLDLGPLFGRLVRPREERFKHTVYECGVRVPLIVRGPGVAAPGRASDALVDAPDLWETIRELLGVERAEVLPEGHAIDGVSFLDVLRDPDCRGARRFSLVEHFEPGGNPERISYEPGAMRPNYLLRRGFVLATEAGRFKLVRNLDQGTRMARDRLFQLSDAEGRPVDPWEQRPLAIGRDAEYQATYQELESALDALLHSEARNWAD